MSASPPRLAQWLVDKTLPPDPAERDAVLGDLAEEHAAIGAERSRRAADAWYWRQTLRSVLPNLRRRLAGRPAGHPARERGGVMETVFQDIRYGARMLRRRPTIAIVALASLIVGISLPAVVFSLLDAVLLRPIAVEEPDRVAILLEVRDGGGTNHNFSYPDFTDFRSSQRDFTDLVAYSRADVTIQGAAGSKVVAAELVSGSYFSTLGIRLRGGRGLTDGDDRSDSAPAVVVSDALWKDVAGDAPFAPRTLVVNTREFAVVGVVAAPFRGMEVGRDVRLWAPIHAQPVLDPAGGRNIVPLRTASWLTIAGRLRAGVTRDRAAADMTGVDASLASTTGRSPRILKIASGRQGDSMLPEVTGGPLTLLLGAALLVLLVACGNVANLLLARATERTREIAVRAALGAGRARLARLVLIETLMLSIAGTCAALVAARWIARMVAPFISRFGEPATLDVTLDLRVLAFVVAIAVLTTMLTGLAPVLAVMRQRRSASLADGGRAASAGPSRTRTRRALVVTQFALSLALVVAALLLARTVRNLQSVPTGFEIDRVAVLSVDPSAAQLDGPQARAYLDSSLERLTRVPGVRAAGFGRVIPLGFGGSRTTIAVTGYQPAPEEDMEINFNIVSPSYFEATGIALVNGRAFTPGDSEGREAVAIVNETMARRYWPNRNAVGQQISLGGDTPPARVIGVARDVKYRMLREPSGPSFYLPLGQQRARAGVIHVRVEGDPRAVLDTLRRTLAEVNPAVPITSVRTLREQANLNLNDERLAMIIGVTLGGAALLLAAVGLYGSLAYMVGQRTRELGIRMALGATGRDVSRLVLWQGVTLSLAGTLLGAWLAIALARTLESRLFGVRASDVPTLLAAAIALAAVALAASWMPARRAARVNPVDALRAE